MLHQWQIFTFRQVNDSVFWNYQITIRMFESSEIQTKVQIRLEDLYWLCTKFFWSFHQIQAIKWIFPSIDSFRWSNTVSNRFLPNEICVDGSLFVFVQNSIIIMFLLQNDTRICIVNTFIPNQTSNVRLLSHTNDLKIAVQKLI